MSTPEHDVEYRLDADHIHDVCRAEQPDGSINVTQVDGSPHDPPYVTVDDLDFPHSVHQALRKVGYLTHIPDNSNTVVVTGWSTTQLGIRAAALNGILARWRDTLTDTAARAVDIYALTHHRWTPPAARRYTTSTALLVQEFEAKLVTGPHATHDPNIRPHDETQARLLADNQRLEQAIAAHLDQARRVAGYAVTAYIDDPDARTEPTDARARAITSAMGRHSADIRSEYARLRTASPAAPGQAAPDHPAAVAANDQPAETTPPAAVTAIDASSTANAVGSASTSSARRRTP